jgi:hypothetical protein
VVPNVGNLNDIACVSVTTCEAVGFDNSGGVVVPIIDGAPGTPVPVAGTGLFYGVNCASAATCVAVGTNPSTSEGVIVVINEPPTDAKACKKGGWRNFRSPAFKNQGECVSYVNAHRSGPA